MVELSNAQIKERVVAYLRGVPRAKNRDVAAAINVPRALVARAVSELAKEDRVEFICLGTSDEAVRIYVALKGRQQEPAGWHRCQG